MCVCACVNEVVGADGACWITNIKKLPPRLLQLFDFVTRYRPGNVFNYRPLLFLHYRHCTLYNLHYIVYTVQCIHSLVYVLISRLQNGT